MNWEEFNDVVRTYLLVDSERKGRGVQNYIDRMIVASVIDLQRYVPAIRANQYKFFSPSSLVEPNPTDLTTVNAEDVDVHQGVFDSAKTRIKQVVVRRIPTESNNQELSRYFYPRTIPWETRFNLIDGGNVERTSSIPGRITFGPSYFWTAPQLTDEEAMYIYYEGENHYSPLFNATTEEKATPVVFDDMVAKASADYVKAHLAREVDNDLTQYQSYFAMYAKDRAQVFLNEKEYQSSSVEQTISSGVGGTGFTIG
ncbi:MAG: hypothetical protein CMC82_06020 [Flavobacteriaceae bacterium]|nr:hypothetical protein [Flavobacteriaceae bacterium]|tara:strand:- start:3150 stop:3917 length:768 start_codon:yes stop_codon:yes gene_type:complete